MTDKVQKIRKEVERLKEIAEYNLLHCKMDRSAWIQQASVCTKLLSFINSMQEDSVSEDLEEEALVYAATGEISLEGKLVIDEEIYETFKAGANWQKEKLMMNNAITAEYWDNSLMLDAEMRGKYSDGNKVKLIIIKED